MKAIRKQAADTPGAPLKKKDLRLWTLQDHICRKCFGRILATPDGDTLVLRCSNCGYEVSGDQVSAICCCGIKYKKGGRKGSKNVAPQDAGIRCIRNPHITSEFCCEIVASEVAFASK